MCGLLLLLNVKTLYRVKSKRMQPQHTDSALTKIHRTDSAVVDFSIESIEDIIVHVFERNIFKKTNVEIWKMSDLLNAINNDECTIEFIYQYRSHFEQMWQCAIHSKKKPYYRECQLHMPETEATFRWNNLSLDCEW